MSAHRFGAGPDRSQENSLAALDRALALGVDYVEFDVHRTSDGLFVIVHDSWVESDGRRVSLRSLTEAQLRDLGAVVTLEDVLTRIAGRARAHIDLKLGSPADRYADPSATYEVTVTTRALEALGEGNLVVTTGRDRAVRALRDWADAEGHQLLVGLSVGRSAARRLWGLGRRLTVSRANVVVAHYALARLGVAAYARHRRLPLLVWTVDSQRELRHWLRPGRAWMVTTNEPALALRIRAAGPLT